MKGAATGKLAIMASGPARRHASRCSRCWRCWARCSSSASKPGLGQTVKLANNLMSAASLAIAAEAMAMGVKAGVDPAVMLEVLNASSGRNSATQDKIPKHVLNRKFDFGFANALSFKDVRLCLEEAEALGVPMVVGAAVRQMLSITQQSVRPGCRLHGSGEGRGTAGRAAEIGGDKRRNEMGNEKFDKGLKLRKQVLGAEYVEKSMAERRRLQHARCRSSPPNIAGAMSGPGPGLALRDRSLINIAMISALNRPHELKLHVKAALNNGLSREEIREVHPAGGRVLRRAGRHRQHAHRARGLRRNRRRRRRGWAMVTAQHSAGTARPRFLPHPHHRRTGSHPRHAASGGHLAAHGARTFPAPACMIRATTSSMNSWRRCAACSCQAIRRPRSNASSRAGTRDVRDRAASGKLLDGRKYNNRYAWSVDVRDGLIFAIREYMDSHYVATLFGFKCA